MLYERALLANSHFSMASRNLAIAYTDLGTRLKVHAGNVVEGIKCYKLALKYNPEYPDAWYNLGVAYVRLFLPALFFHSPSSSK